MPSLPFSRQEKEGKNQGSCPGLSPVQSVFVRLCELSKTPDRTWPTVDASWELWFFPSSLVIYRCLFLTSDLVRSILWHSLQFLSIISHSSRIIVADSVYFLPSCQLWCNCHSLATKQEASQTSAGKTTCWDKQQRKFMCPWSWHIHSKEFKNQTCKSVSTCSVQNHTHKNYHAATNKCMHLLWDKYPSEWFLVTCLCLQKNSLTLIKVEF